MAEIRRTFWFPYEIINNSNDRQLQENGESSRVKGNNWESGRLYSKFFQDGGILFESTDDRDPSGDIQKEFFRFDREVMFWVWERNRWVSLPLECFVAIPSQFYDWQCGGKAEIIPGEPERDGEGDEQFIIEDCFIVHKGFFPIRGRFYKEVL